DLGGRVGVASADQYSLAGQQGLAEDLQAGVAQRGAGGDDVGDRVGDVEPNGRLDRAVEPDHLGGDAALDQVGLDDAGVAGGDPLALELLEGQSRPGPGGEPERRAGEPERQDRVGLGAGVEQQVLAGDADVQPAGADVDGDVARAEEEELGVVVRVDQD